MSGAPGCLPDVLCRSSGAPIEHSTARPSCGYRLPSIVQQPPVEVKLSKLELCAPRLIEVYLRDFDWATALGSFFRTTSPQFEGFRERAAAGRSFDLRMQGVHAEFLDTVMGVLAGQFEDMDYSEEKFVAAILAGRGMSGPNAAAGDNVKGFLDGLADFETFGEMMEDMFALLYRGDGGGGCPVRRLLRPPTDPPTGSAKVRRRFSEVLVHDEGTAVRPKECRCVRVLWDIENVSVSKKEGGIDVVSKLNAFLAPKGLFGPGIDLRITAFFDPSGGAVSKQTINELDKAAVELVWVSSKREDADRKLGMRISQEMQVLPPSSTTFVIITSDQDFRHHFQLLRNAGYRVVVVHNARTGKWAQTLEMHCSESYSWSRDVLKRPTVDPEQAHSADVPAKGNANKQKNDAISGKSCGIPAVGVSLPPVDQWVPGSCKSWKGKYGFVKVVTGAGPLDVYLHSSILPPECRGVLSLQEPVEVMVEPSAKGPRARGVRLVTT